MKKIIDLIEKYFELDDNAPAKEAVEERDKWADTIWHIEQEIGDRVARRRELEATPITEDWLKEHGWEVHEGLRGFIPAPYANRYIGRDYLEYDMRRASLRVFLEYVEGDGTYSDFYCENIDSVAKLLDACELCGINLEM